MGTATSINNLCAAKMLLSIRFCQFQCKLAQKCPDLAFGKTFRYEQQETFTFNVPSQKLGGTFFYQANYNDSI